MNDILAIDKRISVEQLIELEKDILVTLRFKVNYMNVGQYIDSLIELHSLHEDRDFVESLRQKCHLVALVLISSPEFHDKILVKLIAHIVIFVLRYVSLGERERDLAQTSKRGSPYERERRALTETSVL